MSATPPPRFHPQTTNGSTCPPPEPKFVEGGEIDHLDLNPVEGITCAATATSPPSRASPTTSSPACPYVAPITGGGDFARIAGFTVSLFGCGLITSGVVRLDQLRPVDLQARGGKRIESIPPLVLEDILNRVLALFEPA